MPGYLALRTARPGIRAPITKICKDSKDLDTDLAIMKIIKQRCTELLVNLVFLVVPEDEDMIYKKMGF